MTVMFTDIREFSTLAEHMDAKDIADLLNRHFQLLSSCIEAEGGTIDKFIGDSVMAFWGAPEQIPDHAERALRAARAIQRAVIADNRRRREAGEPILAARAAPLHQARRRRQHRIVKPGQLHGGRRHRERRIVNRGPVERPGLRRKRRRGRLHGLFQDRHGGHR